jgi:hypothetical protein
MPTNKLNLGLTHKSSSFFQPKGFTQKQYVDVGGYGDCGFRAIAAGLIDLYDSDKIPVNIAVHRDMLRIIISRHYDYFPRQEIVKKGAKYGEKFKDLIDTQPRSVLVETLAFTLRQLAVDEICKKPQLYRGAFIADNNVAVSPEEMRKPTTYIDETAIAALSKVLNLPVQVTIVQRSKKLPNKLIYNQEAESKVAPKIAVRLENKHYIPKVYQPKKFKPPVEHQVALIKKSIESPSLRQKINHIVDPDMDDIMGIIEKDDIRMLKEYDEAVDKLEKAVSSGELTKQDLLDTYIKGMKDSDYLRGRGKYIGMEHGNQRFFEELLHAYGKQEDPYVNLSQTHQQHIVGELIQAISRAISVGQLEPQKVIHNEAVTNVHPIASLQ